MGEKIPIVGYPARGQAPEIFAMRLNFHLAYASFTAPRITR